MKERNRGYTFNEMGHDLLEVSWKSLAMTFLASRFPVRGDISYFLTLSYGLMMAASTRINRVTDNLKLPPENRSRALIDNTKSVLIGLHPTILTAIAFSQVSIGTKCAMAVGLGVAEAMVLLTAGNHDERRANRRMQTQG